MDCGSSHQWPDCPCRLSSCAQKRVRLGFHAGPGPLAQVRTCYPYTCDWARGVYVYAPPAHPLPRRIGYAFIRGAPIYGRRNRYAMPRRAGDEAPRRNGYAAETGSTAHFGPFKPVYAESGSLLMPSNAETGTESHHQQREEAAWRTRFCGDKRLSGRCFALSTTCSGASAQKRVRFACVFLWKSLWDQ